MPPVARRARLVAALRVTAVMSGATWPPAKADQRAARAGMGPRPPASGRAGARALRAARTPAHRPAARPPPQAGAPLKTKSTAKSTAKSKPAWQEGGCATPACSRKCASRKISPDRSFAFVSCSQLPDAARKNAHRYDELASGPTYYNYFRDYDPGIGRYSQSDPIGLSGGLNLYDYVGADPLNYVDPDGQLRCKWVGPILHCEWGTPVNPGIPDLPKWATSPQTASGSSDNCPTPCNPPEGTRCWVEGTGKPHAGYTNHWDIYEMQRRRADNVCFWAYLGGKIGRGVLVTPPPATMQPCSAYPNFTPRPPHAPR